MEEGREMTMEAIAGRTETANAGVLRTRTGGVRPAPGFPHGRAPRAEAPNSVEAEPATAVLRRAIEYFARETLW